MPRFPVEQTEACSQCGFNDVPTFRFEERIAYREVGKPEEHNYSRSVYCTQKVLTCLSCGQVHRIVSKADA